MFDFPSFGHLQQQLSGIFTNWAGYILENKTPSDTKKEQKNLLYPN
jgi:hypothetical protein